MSKGAKRLMHELNILDFASDEPKIDAAVAPLSEASEPLMSRLRYRESRWNDALEPEEQGSPLPDELTIEVTVKELRDLRKALETWRTGR